MIDLDRTCVSAVVAFLQCNACKLCADLPTGAVRAVAPTANVDFFVFVLKSFQSFRFTDQEAEWRGLFPRFRFVHAMPASSVRHQFSPATFRPNTGRSVALSWPSNYRYDAARTSKSNFPDMPRDLDP